MLPCTHRPIVAVGFNLTNFFYFVIYLVLFIVFVFFLSLTILRAHIFKPVSLVQIENNNLSIQIYFIATQIIEREQSKKKKKKSFIII